MFENDFRFTIKRKGKRGEKITILLKTISDERRIAYYFIFLELVTKKEIVF